MNFRKLGEECCIIMGQSPQSKTYNTKKEGIAFLQGRKTFGRMYPYIDTWTTQPIKIGQKDSILMSVRAPVGDVNIATEEICIGRGLASICMKNKHNLYLYYLLLNNINHIKNKSAGTVFEAINKSDLENLILKFHNEKDQCKVEKILGTIDEKIELNNQINNNLHEIVEIYFKKLSKDGIETKLEDLIFEIQSGSREKGGAVTNGIASIGAEKIEKLGIYNFESEKYISEEYFKKMKNGIVKSGDVLLYKDGAYTGKVSMAMKGFPHKNCAINEHVFILRTKNNWANCYLYFLLYDSKIREQVQAMASSKAAQPGLNQTEVKSVKIMQPSREKIMKFEEKAKVIVEKIIQNSIENKNLEQLRDTLLPKLMNGKIDLDKMDE